MLRLVLGSLFVLIGLGKFNGDPHGMWYHVFARIGFGQWFRVATGIIQLTGGMLFVLPGTCRIGGAMLAGTMLGAMLAQLTVLGNPLVVFIPGALFAAVIVVALRDPTLDATIATLEARKARRKL